MNPQALHKFENIIAIMGKAVEKNMSEQIGGALIQARATQTVACLLHLLCNGTERQKVRSGVQAELKRFRTLVGKEHERKFLPHIILEKAESVLKGGAS